MYKEIERCIGELRVNHTDKEIAGAFSEYFQIVKSVSYDYTDAATVAELRADHPELSFMDDDEIEEILEQAKVMRHKREAPEEEYLTVEDMQELFRCNEDWGKAGSEQQHKWIQIAAAHSTTVEELAGMIWICTEHGSIDDIESTMREYLKEKREKERGSTDWSTEGL